MSRPLDPIAGQLRAERKRLGLSLPAASARVGLEAVVIGSYERGDRIPPLDRLRTWTEGLGHHLLAVPATNGALAAAEGNGQLRIEYALTVGDELIECDSEEEACRLAGVIDGSVVVSQMVHVTGWEPVR